MKCRVEMNKKQNYRKRDRIRHHTHNRETIPKISSSSEQKRFQLHCDCGNGAGLGVVVMVVMVFIKVPNVYLKSRLKRCVIMLT